MAGLLSNLQENKKTDNQYPFLQSLSHEVRTPLNAIVGLSEILLMRCQDLEEREYLMSMQAATQHLVMVINNVIDYDALNSGTLSLHRGEISLEKLIHDIIAMGRLMIGDRDVLFVTDVNPELPEIFISDEVRIKQFLVYFLSNASKNVNKGHIGLCVDYSDERKEFLRFTIENTEPGLPIMSDLIEALGSKLEAVTNDDGSIDVHFDVHLVLPEGAVDKLREKLPGTYAVCLKNKREREMLIKYFERSQVRCTMIENPTELFIFREEERPDVLITDYERLDKLRSIKEFRDLGIRLLGVASERDANNKNDSALLLRPVFYKDMEKLITEPEEEIVKEKEKLLLEGVRILVVDDNAINLKVSEGLLEPYKCSVDTATGAEEAIRMVHQTKYDLVFMDHMMPEMDGTEAVKIIREAEDEYFKTLPIIALTANVLEESRQLFFEVGMNDFIAKPIEIKVLDDILKKWIPKSKQTTQISSGLPADSGLPNFDELNIREINPRVGISYTGGNGKMYMTILSEYLSTAPAKRDLLTKLKDAGDVSRYTIEVHALKSLSKTIGAARLSSIAEELEKKGHRRDIDGIVAGHDELVEVLNEVISELERITGSDKPKDKKQPMEKEKVSDRLKDVFHAMEDFDYDLAEHAMAELEKYEFDEIAEDVLTKLKESVNSVDYDESSKQAVRMMALMGDK